jgi:hypothetical protein
MATASKVSLQFVTTQRRAKALARSLTVSVLPVPAGPAGASQFEGQCGGKSHDTTISEGRDEQADIESLILVTVVKATHALTNVNFVLIIVPVETELTLPHELLGEHDRVTNKGFDNVTSVHIENNHSLDKFT